MDKKAARLGKTILYLVIIVVFFDLFVHIPVISPYASFLGADLFIIGVIVAAYSISNMAGNFFAGYVINSMGRKKPIVLGTLFTGIAVLLYSLSQTPAAFTFFRILHGLAVSFITPAAFTLLGDESDPEKRGKTMAKSGLAISIAALTGPPLGGFLKANLGFNSVFILVSAIMLLISLISYLYLKEPTLEKDRESSPLRITRLFKNRHLQIVYTAAFSLMFAKGVLMFKLPLYVENDLGYTSVETGLLFGAFAVSAIILFLLPTNLSDRVGRIGPLLAGLAIISIAVTGIHFLETFTSLFMIMLFYGIGFGLLFPSMTALLVDSTTARERGAAFGIFYGIFSLGVIIGPILTGYLIRFNLSPFLVAGPVVLLFVFILGGMTRTKSVT